MPQSYRERLRVEGLTLAACGAAGSLALLALEPESRRNALSTVVQLAVVVLLLELLGTRSVRRWLRESLAGVPGGEGSGEPTPLWQLPAITVGLTALVAVLLDAGWDAGLRVTLGCMLVGLWQGARYERIVAADETARGGRHFRAPGSRIGRGTQLVFVPRS